MDTIKKIELILLALMGIMKCISLFIVHFEIPVSGTASHDINFHPCQFLWFLDSIKSIQEILIRGLRVVCRDGHTKGRLSVSLLNITFIPTESNGPVEQNKTI